MSKSYHVNQQGGCDVQVGSSGRLLANKVCSDYGKLRSDLQRHIIKLGKTKASRQRYEGKTCGKTSTESIGTLLHCRRTPEDEIIDTLAHIAEGNRISSLVRTKGHTEDTIIYSVKELLKTVVPPLPNDT
jgi:transposase-like protein